VARENKVDRRLAKGFKESLASVIGESGSQVVVSLGKIPEDRLDPEEIDSTLNMVFGAAPAGLSTVKDGVLEGMSSRLGVDIPKERPESGNFYSSLVYMSERYRLKQMTGFGLAGVAAAVISSVCCLGPIALALLGLSSLSAGLSLAESMTDAYQPFELLAAVAFLGIVIYSQLRKSGECNPSGLRRNFLYFVIPAVTLLVTLAVISYWVNSTFYYYPMGLLP